MPKKEIISSDKLAPGRGLLSQATRFGNMVFVQGCTGRHPTTNDTGKDIREQTRFTLDRMALGYERVMEQVSGTQTDPRLAELPPHLRGDGTELASAILSDFGFDNPLRGNRLGSAQE